MASDAVGIAWYEREAYDRLRVSMDDADAMPDTFDEWLERAGEFEIQLTARGFHVLHVLLDLETFLAWCTAQGLVPAAEARSRYAADHAEPELQALRDPFEI